jgi:hypothetical protein
VVYKTSEPPIVGVVTCWKVLAPHGLPRKRIPGLEEIQSRNWATKFH